MKVVVKNKRTFGTIEYDNVTNIAYDATTKIYTISYGSPIQTATFSADTFLVAIMFK